MTEINRREAMKRLMAAIAAGVAVPAIVGAVDWKPAFLNAKQDELLAAVSETIVPGSGAAKVNRFVDLLLSVDSSDRQKAFVASLAAVDEISRSQFQKSFAELNEGEREKAITSLSQNQNEAFANLKEWIVGAYYSSEYGMKELGWDGNFAFDKYPVCGAAEGRS
jgi:Gluconate 2-dehydrogenase subunit 3